MTDIKIRRLCLENFKCHSSLRLDFEGGNASIYGDNASGKTSIYDAFVWLLFGKDSTGNGEKNIEIKPLDANGQVKDHLAVTAVEAVLAVNGEEVSLRRTYREVWTTKRGSSQATYDGNTSEYFVSGVPCKKNAFQDKVSELVSEDTFRMLTSVSYFTSGISWQDRRAVLFQVAGVMDDGQILATNEQFFPLVEGMGRLSLEDYKKKLLAEKRKFVGAKTDIPARISECQKTVEDLEGLDFTGAKAEVEALQARQDSISARIVAIEHDSAADQKRMEIREAQLELNKLESANKVYRDQQTAGSVDTKGMNRELMLMDMSLRGKRDAITGCEKTLEDYDRRIGESRSRWISVNGERFSGGSCPTCGQKLPAEQLLRAEDAFESGKRSRLQEIEQTANALKQARADTAVRKENLQKEILELEAGIADTKLRLEAAEAARVEPRDMEGFQQSRDAIKARIDALSGELEEIARNSYDVREALRREKEAVALEMAEQLRTVNKESLLEYARQRIEALRLDAKNAAECLEAIEKMLYLMDEYSRYKTRFVEDSINARFRISRFRLFREQANGGVEDRCDVVYDGIPYISVNNGMKINLGIDIINTLSEAYGVRVPLFVDNAESVTNLEKCGSQIIRLVVSENDKELRVKYED
jgi:hypothetical protein